MSTRTWTWHPTRKFSRDGPLAAGGSRWLGPVFEFLLRRAAAVVARNQPPEVVPAARREVLEGPPPDLLGGRGPMLRRQRRHARRQLLRQSREHRATGHVAGRQPCQPRLEIVNARLALGP